MKIQLNERETEVPEGATLMQLRAREKPSADVLICNGAVAAGDLPLAEGDRVNLIARGEIPPAEELEALMAARHTPGVHGKIKGATVGIAGLGGLGSSVAVALARIGVGRLILVDFDVVEPSNLNRQQYFIDQIGLPKTEALEANLWRINPYVEYQTHCVRVVPENISELFGEVDVLVEAFDRADQKAMLLQSFGDAPIVVASGMAGYGSGESIGVRRMGKRIYVVGDLETGAAPGYGLMAPRVGIAAHMQANVVLRLLLGEEHDLSSRLTAVSLDDRSCEAGNLFDGLPKEFPEELSTLLAESKNAKVERIVSDGHASPEGFWYDQGQDEWVLLVAGSAVLEFEDRRVRLEPGDHLLIPAHRRHRVESTSQTEKTVWLAVYL